MSENLLISDAEPNNITDVTKPSTRGVLNRRKFLSTSFLAGMAAVTGITVSEIHQKQLDRIQQAVNSALRGSTELPEELFWFQGVEKRFYAFIKRRRKRDASPMSEQEFMEWLGVFLINIHYDEVDTPLDVAEAAYGDFSVREVGTETYTPDFPPSMRFAEKGFKEVNVPKYTAMCGGIATTACLTFARKEIKAPDGLLSRSKPNSSEAGIWMVRLSLSDMIRSPENGLHYVPVIRSSDDDIYVFRTNSQQRKQCQWFMKLPPDADISEELCTVFDAAHAGPCFVVA